MPFFSPLGYGFRFDAFANILVSLLEVAEEDQRPPVDAYLESITPEDLALVPAFHPVITPQDRDWQELQMTFSYSFKNQPYEYHNGGLWPMLTGFRVAELAWRGDRDGAQRGLEAIHRANALPMDGEDWSFPEFVHGRELAAGGTRHQGWSAAAAVIGHHALEGMPVLRETRDGRAKARANL
ncbi:MAG: glycoside hydrolase 100 family protein [Thiohalorhabdaceae bacterium]